MMLFSEAEYNYEEYWGVVGMERWEFEMVLAAEPNV